MRYLFILSFSLLVISASAQRFPSEFWYPGEATLTSEEKVSGKIKYDLEIESIQIIVNDKVETYSANQLLYFSIKPENRPDRVFYSLPFRNETGYVRPQFFELVQHGNTTLLAREYVETRIQGSNARMVRTSRLNPFLDPMAPGMTTRAFLAYRVFIAKPSGKIIELGNSKKEVVSAFGDNQSDLKKYIKQEKLNMERLSDLAMLVTYYNRLTS